MERAYSLKEIYLDHLIGVTGIMESATRLHTYDIDQCTQRFGVSSENLRKAVEKCGPDLERVEAELVSSDKSGRAERSLTGPAIRGNHRPSLTEHRALHSQKKREEVNG